MFTASKKKSSFGQFNTLLQGIAKSGKSTIASKFVVDGKPPAFIATEDGHHELGVDVSRVSNWKEFKVLVKHIEENKDSIKGKYSCLVVDLVSDLAEMCEDYVRERKQIEDISDLEWGKGYSLVAREFRTTINRLFAIIPLTFISHVKLREVEELGKNKEKFAPDLPKKIYNYLNGKCDLIAFILPPKDNQKLAHLSMIPNDKYVAGSRIKSLCKAFPLDPNDMAKSFKAIEAAIQ